MVHQGLLRSFRCYIKVMATELLTEFAFEEGPKDVMFMETMQIAEDVECDVYSFKVGDGKDLGIIRVGPGAKTPLQKVLGGERTVEGHVSGKGLLIITRANGEEEIHSVDDSTVEFQIDVGIGDTMQWQADEDFGLTAFEICIPPYQDGRYENLE